jgi:hypothetical protein
LLKDKETCSRTKKLAQGQRNLLKDKETCSRTLKLVKELWNVLKNFGTCSRTSEVKLCLVLELTSYDLELGYALELTHTTRSTLIRRFLTFGSLIKEVKLFFFHAECITVMQDHFLDVPTISLGK